MTLQCGKCRARYEMAGGIIGQPDLEEVRFNIEGRLIPGTDINICPQCAFYALLGTNGFVRKGNIVYPKTDF